MDIKEHTTPDKLERYAFLWSLARLVIAAFSLFFGAMPIAYKIIGYQSMSLVAIAWLISGVSAGYLGYLWYSRGQKVFGTDDKTTKILFLAMVVTGINLGYVAIGNINLGMSLLYSMPIAGIIFKITALAYLYVAYELWTKWKANGEVLFSAHVKQETATPSIEGGITA